MDVINYTIPTPAAPVVNTVERVVTKTERVPVLPDRPLTQGELDMLMWQSRAAHRERVLGTVAGTVGGLGTIALIGYLFYKMYKLGEDMEKENSES